MLFTPRFLVTILSVLFFLFLLTLWHRTPTGDDAWFAEQSYWLQKDGLIRSEFFRGTLGWENQLLVSHKLFLLFGAGLIKLFGFGLPTVQFVGLIPFVIILVEITAYIRQKNKLNPLYFIFLVLILIFSNRLLIRLSFENRPELMLAALGFGSFLCLKPGSHPLRSAALAGLLAGLAMLCHLNGVIYLIAGAGTYLYTRRFKEAVLFSIVGGLTLSGYFIDIVQAKDGFSIWYYQFRHDPATQTAFGWHSKLVVMLTFPKMFFESPEQAALSGLLVFMLWHQRRFIHQLPRLIKVYPIILLISFWIITKHGSGSYMPLFMPFMLVILYELYYSNPFMSWGLRSVLAAYFIIGLYGTVEIIYRNYALGSLPVAYQKLRPYIPGNATGLVPLTFFFDEYDQYPRLLCHENFINYSTQQDDLPVWANHHKADFILLDYVYRPEAFYPKPGTTTLPFYKLTYYDGRFAVYSHNRR
ncbi:hypothetical protein [Spirosoma fluviale]|uniref:Glycosyltransferase RgtA/B/C/D-like domain-containing protein n=1 Tax=Spirosoma fluviale TaxID=1597977 RepID=A0A286GJ51_9BACT|nr:hypothetical protein [Spirosoma fluviale]SOD95530.1 hypothetical protein SAMN06269250_4895 [Spirosoma fluviale]